MSYRRACVPLLSAMLFYAASAPAAGAQPLEPVKPWVVHYEPATCTADRAYANASNPTYLGLEPSAWGNTYDLVVAANGVGPRHAKELAGSVDFGHGPIKAWLLHYGLDEPTKLNFYKFRISAAEMAQAKSAASATFHVDGQADFTFSLAQVPDLLKTLAACTTDLQHYWNMIDPEQKNIAAPAVGDVRQVFSGSDYPEEALSRNQGGTAEFLLLVDEKGKVAECSVLKPSGIPALDGMGCQVIRKRAQFKPALDRHGKPTRSAVTTPPVTWRMYE